MVNPSKELFCILFLINSFGSISHRKKLQKLIFIAKKKFNFDISFNFMPYLYGPYSSELSDFIKVLVADGLITEKITTGSVTEYSYSLTQLGKTVLESMEKSIDKSSIEKLNQVIKLCSNKTTPEIVSIAKEVMKK
jgi:uncharacterized protein YwgA